MIKIYSKIVSTAIISITYLSVFFVVYFLFPALHFSQTMVNVFIADAVATVLVFTVSVMFNNSSVYDPYWSVAPPIIVIYLMQLFPEGNEIRQFVLLALVFLGCLPMWYALSSNEPFNIFDMVAAIFTFSAIMIEWIADEQLIKFRKTSSGKSFMNTGLWAVSRHPNYLGEISFWGGIFLFAVSATGFIHSNGMWTVVGFISMVILFKFISIPLMEKRNIERKPGYQEYIKKVPALFPRIL